MDAEKTLKKLASKQIKSCLLYSWVKYRYSFSFNNKTYKELFFCEPIIGWQVRKDVISAVNNFTRNIVLMKQLFKITFDGASALEYEEDEGWVCRDNITHAIYSLGGNSQSKYHSKAIKPKTCTMN